MCAIVWDSTNNEFVASTIMSDNNIYVPYYKVNPPADEVIWNYEKVYLPLRKNVGYTYSWCSNQLAYLRTTAIEDPQVDSYNWKVDKNEYVSGIIDDANETISYPDITNFILLSGTSFDAVNVSVGLQRFRSTYKKETYLTNFTTSFLNPNGYHYSNLVDAEAKNKNGYYFTELTLSERVV
jgi:hypothetical protein